MNTKSKIAIAAVLVSAFASPSFAQFGVGADPVTDGRTLPTVYSMNDAGVSKGWTAGRSGAGSIDAAQIERLSQGNI